MATFKALTVQSGGPKQQQAADTLDVGSGITTPTGTNLSVDTTGANTLSIGGTNATSMTIGRAGQTITMPGNLSVTGTTTTVNTTDLQVKDKLIQINYTAATDNAAVPAGMIGVTVVRGAAAGTYRDAASMLWDETNGRFQFAWITANDQTTQGTDLGLKLGAVTTSGNFSQTGATTFGTGTGVFTHNGNIAAGGAINVDFSASSGTFLTPTGNVTVGGTIQGNLTFGTDANHLIQGTVSGGTTGTAGKNFTFQAAQGGLGAVGVTPTTAGGGGTNTIQGGTGGSATASGTAAQGSNAGGGGAVTVQGGTGGAGAAGVGQGNSGGGGTLNVTGGTGAVGIATSTAGQLAANAGAGANVVITGGVGGAGTTTGTISNGTAGAGGAVQITGGNAGTAGASGTANGGSVTVDGGVQTGGGTNGSVTIGGTNASAIGIGRTGITTTVTGTMTVAAGSTLNTTSTGNINLPQNVNARFQIEGVATAASVTSANLATLTNGSNADALHTHTGLTASQTVITGLTTTGLADGDFGYISTNNTLTKTDSAALASSRVFGANEGTVGAMTVGGIIENAKFTTAGGSPGAGAPVYLAAGTDDTSTGAGKLTATAPTAGVISEVGLCMDNTNYAGLKTCKVLMQPKAPISL